MNYKESVAYLESLEFHGIKLGLANMEMALLALGSPQKKFKSVLVAGTNGKGSTCAFLARILSANGHKTGFYSSPHLVSYNERFVIANKTIPNAEFASVATHVRAILEDQRLQLTLFEVLTAMACVWFERKNVDFAVLEVGLGGRLDATNAVDSVANVITHIGLDHQEYLGSNLRQIASEKAGILKNAAPLVCAERSPELQALFRDLAIAHNAPSHFIEKDFFFFKKSVSNGLETMDFKGGDIEWNDLAVSLWGDHQLENAAVALATAATLKQQKLCRLSEPKTRAALATTKWPGRFDILQHNPIVLLDACHNPDGVRAFCAAFRARFPAKKSSFVIGISSDKNSKEMLSMLLPLGSSAIFCEAHTRATPCTELAQIGKEYLPAFKIQTIPDVKTAVKGALKSARPDDIICVCGSMFVLGEALELKWPDQKKAKKTGAKKK
jgi:dihydrofolate synthase/folylpolyglutamate synthase